MKRVWWLLLQWMGILSLVQAAEGWYPGEWPVLKRYDSAHLYRVALPLGGIGTGTVFLGGRGELRDWEIMNVPAKRYSTVTDGNNAPFFSLYCCPEGGTSQTLLLQGPLYDQEYLHYEGRPVNHHGLPRFGHATFEAAYPFGQVHLSDRSLPLRVTIKGFNPLIPGDADASGLPMAVLAYEVSNDSDRPMEVAVCGSLRNFIGKDGSQFFTDWKGDYIPTGAKDNKNSYRTSTLGKGIYFYSDGVDTTDTAWGTMALFTPDDGGVTYRTSSKADAWNNAILNFWDDFSADGRMSEREASGEPDPMASLAVKKVVPAHQTETFLFYFSWHFPNRKAWSQQRVGNYYTHCYADAWEVLEKTLPRMAQLEEETLLFVRSFLSSSLPDVVKEADLVQSVGTAFANGFPFAQRTFDGLGRGNGSLRLLSGLLHPCMEL